MGHTYRSLCYVWDTHANALDVHAYRSYIKVLLGYNGYNTEINVLMHVDAGHPVKNPKSALMQVGFPTTMEATEHKTLTFTKEAAVDLSQEFRAVSKLKKVFAISTSQIDNWLEMMPCAIF